MYHVRNVKLAKVQNLWRLLLPFDWCHHKSTQVNLRWLNCVLVWSGLNDDDNDNVDDNDGEVDDDEVDDDEVDDDEVDDDKVDDDEVDDDDGDDGTDDDWNEKLRMVTA